MNKTSERNNKKKKELAVHDVECQQEAEKVIAAIIIEADRKKKTYEFSFLDFGLQGGVSSITYRAGKTGKHTQKKNMKRSCDFQWKTTASLHIFSLFLSLCVYV